MATETTILDGTIMTQAKAFREARHMFEEQFRNFKMGITPMEPEHFWPMVERFRRVLLDTMLYAKGSVGEAAAGEFLREAANANTLADAVHFALSWRHYRSKAYAAGDETGFSWGRGDDSYGDLMDAVPLLGQIVNRRLCLGKFATLREFNEQVRASCSTFASTDSMADRLVQLVLHGENYFASSLEEAAQKWVVLESRNQ